MRALPHHPDAQPVQRPDGEFRPTVKETIRGIPGAGEVFTFAVKVEPPPTERTLVPGRDARGLAKHEAEHRRDFPAELVATAEFVTTPDRGRLQRLIIVARLQVQTVAIQGD